MSSLFINYNLVTKNTNYNKFKLYFYSDDGMYATLRSKKDDKSVKLYYKNVYLKKNKNWSGYQLYYTYKNGSSLNNLDNYLCSKLYNKNFVLKNFGFNINTKTAGYGSLANELLIDSNICYENLIKKNYISENFSGPFDIECNAMCKYYLDVIPERLKDESPSANYIAGYYMYQWINAIDLHCK